MRHFYFLWQFFLLEQSIKDWRSKCQLSCLFTVEICPLSTKCQCFVSQQHCTTVPLWINLLKNKQVNKKANRICWFEELELRQILNHFCSFFQNPWAECCVESLKQHNVHLARRKSGGGTVYHVRLTLRVQQELTAVYLHFIDINNFYCQGYDLQLKNVRLPWWIMHAKKTKCITLWTMTWIALTFILHT